jgi:hypothetical protein
MSVSPPNLFSMRSVSYQRKVADHFFPQLVVHFLNRQTQFVEMFEVTEHVKDPSSGYKKKHASFVRSVTSERDSLTCRADWGGERKPYKWSLYTMMEGT